MMTPVFLDCAAKTAVIRPDGLRTYSSHIEDRHAPAERKAEAFKKRLTYASYSTWAVCSDGRGDTRLV